MIHAAQAQTLLAKSLPHAWPENLDTNWVEAGIHEQRAAGLPQALFCVRLLDQLQQANPADRFAFLCGAFIAADLDALTQYALHRDVAVHIVGNPALAAAWQFTLKQASISSSILTPTEVEKAFLDGLKGIALHALTISH